MFWNKADDNRLNDNDRANKDDDENDNNDVNEEEKSIIISPPSSSFQHASPHQTGPSIKLPSNSLSLSKRAVHIMNITEGLFVDPVHFHSFTTVGGSSGWIPSPTSIFTGMFHKCGACHGRLGGSATTSIIASSSDNNTNQEVESSGMLHCVACGIYAHRTCAFARRDGSSSNNSNTTNNYCLPICDVNIIEMQRSFRLTREQILQQLGSIPSSLLKQSSQSTDIVQPEERATSSSSWSIFGKRSLTDTEIKSIEEKMLEEKEHPVIAKTEDTTTIQQSQQPGVIQTSLNLIQKSQETSSKLPKASAIGLVAGGAAGLVVAGPAGIMFGSQIGRTVLAGAALVEGGLGISILVMSLAAAANFSPKVKNFATLPSSSSKASEKERELKLNSNLILVRPDIDVDPIWGEYAKEARDLWERKYGKDISFSSTTTKWPWDDLFGPSSNSNLDVKKNDQRRSIRYRKDSDIVKADSSELPMKEKVFLLVNRILNDKTSLPGYQYRHLILMHKRRTMFGTEEDATPDDSAVLKNDGEYTTVQRSCRQDAHGVIKHVTATLLEVRPGLATSPNMTELTASAVELLIFGELYEDCFGEIITETEDRDESLLVKVKELQKKCDDGRYDDDNTTSFDNSDESSDDEVPSSSVSQLAIRALQSLPQAHTPTDKLLHCVEFLEYVSEHFSSSFQGKCIDADTLLIMTCQHVVAANIQHLHAEVAFIEEFSRDEQLLSGKEGYALITLQASLHYLDSVDEFCGILSPKILKRKELGG